MLRQLTLDALDGLDLRPYAVVRKPVAYFRDQFGIRFDETHDDLDVCEIAALSLSDTTPFALMHYRGSPDATTTIYLPSDTAHDTAHKRLRQAQMNRLGREFRLAPGDIEWQRDRDGPSKMAQSQRAAE